MTRRGRVSFISISVKLWLGEVRMTPGTLLEALRDSEAEMPGRAFWLKTSTSRIRVMRGEGNRKGSTCLILEELRMPIESLTYREAELLYWLALSRTTADIATLMGIEMCTVRKHAIELYRKLLVENRTSAALFAHLFSLSEGVSLTDENGAGSAESCAAFCETVISTGGNRNGCPNRPATLLQKSI
jgi:DNA-binding CsgD family transcriptional regulator